MKRKISFVVMGLLLAITQSCEKNDISENQLSSADQEMVNNLTAASAQVATEEADVAITDDIQGSVACNFDSMRRAKGRSMGGNMGMLGGPMKFNASHISDCATVTESDTTYPKTITIDYGTGCTDRKGRVKSGKIVITLTDSMISAGASKTIEYIDFYIDGSKVEMNASMNNLGKNASGNWVVVKSSVQKFTNQDGNAVEEVNNDTTEWVSGFETADKSDNISKKTGSGKITINGELSYSKTITTALYRDAACGYTTAGVMVLYKKSNNIIIDYGDGTCDNKAILTINGTSDEITLNTRGFKQGGKFDNQCQKNKKRGGKGSKGNGFGF